METRCINLPVVEPSVEEVPFPICSIWVGPSNQPTNKQTSKQANKKTIKTFFQVEQCSVVVGEPECSKIELRLPLQVNIFFIWNPETERGTPEAEQYRRCVRSNFTLSLQRVLESPILGLSYIFVWGCNSRSSHYYCDVWYAIMHGWMNKNVSSADPIVFIHIQFMF